jgi:hypothetical protein
MHKSCQGISKREYTLVLVIANAKPMPSFLGDFSNWYMLCYCKTKAISVAKQSA